ncbi:MAG: ankyrin repeat domain-containing protein [Bacillota bacterium]
MKKKLYYLSLVVVMVIMISSLSYAQDDFAGGSGTKEDPYLIETIEQLNNVRDYEGSYFKQISDLDFNDDQEWEPIGEYVDSDNLGFNGVYDGNNKTIKNLKDALFGSVDKNFKIKNLSLKNVNAKKGAGLVYSNFGGTIKNIDVSGKIYGEKYDTAGGLAAFNTGIIKNCSTSIEITTNEVDYIGGLVGENAGSVFNSHSVGKLNVEGENSRFVGGLVGLQSMSGSGHLISSSADVDIFMYLKEKGTAGGLVGYLNSIVENSYAMGNVTGKGDNLGELVGKHNDIGIDRGNTYSMGKVINKEFNEEDSSTLEEFKLIETINQSELQEQIEDLNLNKRNDKGRTLLHHAAIYNNNSAVIKELIDAGININARDTHGYTPLHYAAQYNNVEVLKAFLDTEVGLEKKEGREKTPLHLAAQYNGPEVVGSLIKAGAKIEATDENNQRPLHLAATNNNTEVVELLINENAEMNAEGIWEATPLQLAVLYNGNLEVIDLLIEEGADIEKASSSELNQAIGGFDDRYADERTLNLLSLVAYNGHFNYRPDKRLKEVMKVLINEGINVNSTFDSRSVRNRFHGQPKLEKTILIWSIEYFDDPEFVEYLLEEGAGEDPDIVGSVEGTFSMKALHQAAFNENLEIVKLLIEDYDAGVDGLSYTDDIIKTPLMIAAEKGNEKIVNYLLDAGADGSIEYEGKTAYDYFKENEELEETDTYWRLNDAQYE